MAAPRAAAVTALFDIGRKSNDGRAIETYASWLIRTCALAPCDLHVFLQDTLANNIPAIYAARDAWTRAGARTVVHVMPLECVSLMRDAPRVAAVLRAAHAARADGGPRSPANWLVEPWVLEYTNERYAPLIHSKPSFVVSAAAHDVAHADVPPHAYIWLDAGISRFVSPETTFLRVRAGAIDRALQTGGLQLAASDDYAWHVRHTYEGLLGCGYGGGAFMAGVVIGTQAAWAELRAMTHTAWERDMLQRGRVCNEQMTWAALGLHGPAKHLLSAVTRKNGPVAGVGTCFIPLVYELFDYTVKQADGSLYASPPEGGAAAAGEQRA